MIFLRKNRRKKEEALRSGQRAATLHRQSFYPPKDTMIVIFLGGSVNEYKTHSLTFLSNVTPICPVCEHNCHFHGWYRRKIRDDESVQFISIPRVKRIHCNKTHIVLPDFLAPHKQYTQQVREATVLSNLEDNVSAESLPGNQAVSTSRRWIRGFKSKFRDLVGALTSVHMRLDPWNANLSLDQAHPAFSKLSALCNGICETLGKQMRYSTLFGFVNQTLSIGNMQIWC